MLTELEMLNKIKWDSREDPQEYKIGYIDMGKLKFVEYEEVYIEPGNKFNFIWTGDGELHEIPYHRIKQILRQGVCIWQRKIDSVAQ